MYDNCYEYSNGQWIDGPTMIHQRNLASVAEFGGDGSYWVVGNYGSTGNFRTSEIYRDGGFVEGPELPKEFENANAAA